MGGRRGGVCVCERRGEGAAHHSDSSSDHQSSKVRNLAPPPPCVSISQNNVEGLSPAMDFIRIRLRNYSDNLMRPPREGERSIDGGVISFSLPTRPHCHMCFITSSWCWIQQDSAWALQSYVIYQPLGFKLDTDKSLCCAFPVSIMTA